MTCMRRAVAISFYIKIMSAISLRYKATDVPNVVGVPHSHVHKYTQQRFSILLNAYREKAVCQSKVCLIPHFIVLIRHTPYVCMPHHQYITICECGCDDFHVRAYANDKRQQIMRIMKIKPLDDEPFDVEGRRTCCVYVCVCKH